MRRIVKNGLPFLLTLIGMFALGAACAKAQQITDAKMEPNCSGFDNLQFTATGLQPGIQYTAVFTVTSLCPGSSTPTTHNVSVTFTTPATITQGGSPFTSSNYIQVGNQNCETYQGTNPNTACDDNPGLPASGAAVNYSSSFIGPIAGIYGPLSMNTANTSTNNGCRVTATAALSVNPSQGFVVDVEGHSAPDYDVVVCTLTPTCLEPAGQTVISNTSWNKFNAPSSAVVWIHAHIGKPGNVSTTEVTQVQFTGVTFTLGTKTYQLPDGFLNFDPSYMGPPSTVFGSGFAGVGAWVTTLNPSQLSDEIFFTGAAVPVDSTLTGGGKATFSYTTLSNDSGFDWNWQWSAAVYTFWPTDWNDALILPVHHSLHAGTPQNTMVQHSLIQGPRGGGGSNYTGSWSATGTGICQEPF